MPESFDLIVVGAGPAGSMAAGTAAAGGLSVLLIEEHKQAGIPVTCAEGLSRSTIKDYLDIKPEWISQTLKGSIVRGPSQQEFKIEYPTCGWVLERRVFDAALARQAKSRGAVLRTSARALGIQDNIVFVREAGQTKQYGFKHIIGADGIASRVGTWLGIDTRLQRDEIEVCAEYTLADVPTEPNYAYLIFGHEYAPGGYAWIFPKAKKTANVGLGISPICAQHSAKYYLDRWVAREFKNCPIQRRIFGGVPAKVLPCISGKRFFLVGDAARLTDPLSGAGIANGIKSGVIAARSVMQRLQGKKEQYTQQILAATGREVRYHHRVRRAYLKLNDADLDTIYTIGARIFAGKTVTDINTRHIVKEVILHAPRLLKRAFNLLF